MAAGSNIEWTDATWNPTRGCTRVSPGCVNCYAERQAIRHAWSKPGSADEDGSGVSYPPERGAFHGLVRSTPNGPRWTGKVRLVKEALDLPLRWREPRRIFVDSMSDLFHEEITDEEIDRVFGVMGAAHHHTFQVLTKRADRMRAYFNRQHLDGYDREDKVTMRAHEACNRTKGRLDPGMAVMSWPLPNVWLGVSVEDQQRADERIPHLLATPAAVRFLSVEPLLGPVDLGLWLPTLEVERETRKPGEPYVDWVIVGGESGPGARPCSVTELRQVVAQCRAARVPVFVKQLGADPYDRERMPHDYTVKDADLRHPEALETFARHVEENVEAAQLRLRDRKGGDPSEWPADLRVREFPAARS